MTRRKVGWAPAPLRRAHRNARITPRRRWWTRFRLRSLSYDGQVALPTLWLRLVSSRRKPGPITLGAAITKALRHTRSLSDGTCYCVPSIDSAGIGPGVRQDDDEFIAPPSIHS